MRAAIPLIHYRLDLGIARKISRIGFRDCRSNLLNLPLIHSDVFADCLGGEKRLAAIGGRGQTVKPLLYRRLQSDRHRCSHMCTLSHNLESQQRTRQARRPAAAVDAEFAAGKGAHVKSGLAQAVVRFEIFFDCQQAVIAKR